MPRHDNDSGVRGVLVICKDVTTEHLQREALKKNRIAGLRYAGYPKSRERFRLTISVWFSSAPHDGPLTYV